MRTIKIVNQLELLLVDDEDFEYLSTFRWYLSNKGSHRTIATTKDNRRTSIQRVIMNPPQGMEVDHINRNTFDNQRHNLRICTHKQNLANRSKNYNSPYTYKGVQKNGNRWEATCQGRNCGSYNTEIEAAGAYNTMAIEVYGEFANLNAVPNIPIKYRAAPISIYPGVSFDKREGNWRARASRALGRKWLGYFNTEEEAHEVYERFLVGKWTPPLYIPPQKKRPIPDNFKEKCYGVVFDSRSNRWKAQIKRNGKMVSLGRHETISEASHAVQEYTKKEGSK